jgi:nucleoid-associated protein YgaU
MTDMTATCIEPLHAARPATASRAAVRHHTERNPPRREAPRAGVPTARPAAAVYRRRRLAALAVLIVLVGTVLLVALHVRGAGAALEGPPPAPAVYVVQPGDTLWSIAKSVAPHADTRVVVGRLSKSAGGASLRPGQRLELPGDHGR